MTLQYLLLLAVLAGAALASVMAKKLTPAAALTGAVLGCCIYACAGFAGIALVALFFLLGTWATGFKKGKKESAGLSEKNSSRRNAGQVIANAGVAAICGVIGFVWQAHSALWGLMMAASLSSATADTLSSELGNVYGKKFYNILTLKKDARGLNGVVSLEGTAIGVAGSILIAWAWTAGTGYSSPVFAIVVAAGTIGNLFDSVLGASLERKQYLGNNGVNFLNTAIAALAALLFYFLL